MLNLLTVLVVPSLLIAYHYWSRRHLYAAAAKIKGPKGWPIVGNALGLMGKPEDILDKATAMLSQVDHEPVRLWFGPYLLVALNNPVHLEKIMSSQKFAIKHELYTFLENILGDGLISASGLKPTYKIHRRTIQPLFDLKFVEGTLKIIQRHTQLCMNRLEEYVDTGNFNINEIFHECGVNFTSEIIMGQNDISENVAFKEFSKALADMYDFGFSRMVTLWLHPDMIYKKLPVNKKFQKMLNDLQSFVQESLIDSWKRRKLNVIKEKTDFVPIIDKLSEIMELSPGLINHQDLVNNVITIFAASEDPFSLISSFAAMCFGMYPEYQEKAAKEIRFVLGENIKEITIDDIYKLNYLDMCIKDVMRLFPIAPFILRRVTEDYLLEKWTIPKGSAVVVPIFSLHRDPAFWKNPDHFCPDNFLPKEVQKRHVYAYMPFSAGPRGCIGKTLANAQLKVFIANFLHKFEVETDGKVLDIPLRSDISVRAKNGYHCRIKRRIWK